MGFPQPVSVFQLSILKPLSPTLLPKGDNSVNEHLSMNRTEQAQ